MRAQCLVDDPLPRVTSHRFSDKRAQVRERTALRLHIQMRVTLVNLFIAVTANLPAHISRHARIGQLGISRKRTRQAVTWIKT